MNWGELKTAWHTALGEAAYMVPEFEFGHQIDAAQEFLTSIIPAKMIPEMVQTTSTPGSNTSARIKYGVPAAINTPGLAVVGIRWDPVSASIGHLTASLAEGRRVEYGEFFNLLKFTSDNIYMEVDNVILLSTVFGTGFAYGSLQGIQIAYKKKPAKYGAVYADTSLPTLVLYLKSTSPNTNGTLTFEATSSAFTNFAGLGADPKDYVGGVFIGIPDAPSPYGEGPGSAGQIFEIESAYDDDSSNIGTLVLKTRGKSVALYNNYKCILMGSPDATASSLLSDAGEPELNERWHGAILDLALSRVWLKIGDKDRSQLYASQAKESLQQLGVTTKEIA